MFDFKSNIPTKPSRINHFTVSLFKSMIRIAAGTALILAGSQWLIIAGIGLVAAEILGIVEEMV
jgi:hypothetical protein